MPDSTFHILVDAATATAQALLQSVAEAIRDRLPAALGAGGGVKVDGSGTALPVSGTVAVSSAPTTATTNAILDVATGLADNATVPTRAVQGGGVSSDTQPTLVSAGRLAFLWVRRNGAQMMALLGVDPTAIASGANPLPVRLSDGAAVIVMGQAAPGSSLPVVQAKAQIVDLASIGTTGETVLNGPGSIYWLNLTNSTGSTVFVQVFNRTTAPSGGDRPDYWSSGSFTTGTTTNSLALGHTTEGFPCSTGIRLVLSTTQLTYTAPAGSTAIARVLVR